MGARPSFKKVYILPLIHFAICMVAILAYALPPGLQLLGILWVVLNVVDFPVSAVTIMFAASNHGFLAGAWTVVVGTLWWYFLSRAAASTFKSKSPLCRKQRDKGGAPNSSSSSRV